jgi:hypothetical protein
MIKFKSRHWGTVSCTYPGTTFTDFQALLAAPSKGRWVWSFYYYRTYTLLVGS